MNGYKEICCHIWPREDTAADQSVQAHHPLSPFIDRSPGAPSASTQYCTWLLLGYFPRSVLLPLLHHTSEAHYYAFNSTTQSVGFRLHCRFLLSLQNHYPVKATFGTSLFTIVQRCGLTSRVLRSLAWLDEIGILTLYHKRIRTWDCCYWDKPFIAIINI